MRLPQVILDVVEDPGRRRVLVGCALAVFAAGLLPRTLSPSMPTVQAQLRIMPEIQSLLVLFAFAASANSIAGGVAADIWRRPKALLAGIAIMILGELAAIAFASGPLYYAAQFVAVIAAGLVIAFGIGAVALAFEGIPRATALGLTYGAYGMATATAPAMTVLLGPNGPYWPAYGVAAVVGLVALLLAWRIRPELPGELPVARRTAVSVGLWGIALLAIVSGVLAFSSEGDVTIKLALIAGGVVLIGLIEVLRRRRERVRHDGPVRFQPRQMMSAVLIGGVVGFSQTIPLVLLPAVFLYVLRYDPPFLATAAIAPFAIALIAAGPVAGILLARYSARAILLGGTALLGLGTVGLGVALAAFGMGTSYLWLILPLAAIGAGFVISTTVRTAIVFAATPRGLPGTAAGYNEASVALGARVGIIASTVFVGVVASNSLRQLLAGRPDIESRVAEFQTLVARLGLPEFRTTLGDIAVDDRVLYGTAYLNGVWAAIVTGGAIALIGAVVAWFMVGPGNPLKTVFDLQEERAVEPTTEPSGAA